MLVWQLHGGFLVHQPWHQFRFSLLQHRRSGVANRHGLRGSGASHLGSSGTGHRGFGGMETGWANVVRSDWPLGAGRNYAAGVGAAGCGIGTGRCSIGCVVGGLGARFAAGGGSDSLQFVSRICQPPPNAR